jgi:transcription initiation factor IIE alpha subunit
MSIEIKCEECGNRLDESEIICKECYDDLKDRFKDLEKDLEDSDNYIRKLEEE